ncbi:kinase-like domain-containing protein [Gautieria morchelliformis]|nr:kinase-like domain-containing protein [Gautieria morchelliformis]
MPMAVFKSILSLDCDSRLIANLRKQTLEADCRIYDSGKKLTLFYQRNPDDPNAIENRLLESDIIEGDAWDALYDVLPSITHFYPTITCITLHTIDGKATTTVTEDTDEIRHYPSVPQNLSHILKVPITELENLKDLSIDVDCVRWQGQTYTFKRTGEYVDGTLRELTILDKLSFSPSIISLAAIIVNEDQLIRGFIMPFMLPGDVENIFCSIENDRGPVEDSSATPLFDCISAYNGDLKLQNILLTPTGEAKLIDFLPMGISDHFVAPELLEASKNSHCVALDSLFTGPADVYSLGLVLWAIAEEKYRVERPPVWRNSRIPLWYIELVERCVVLDPEARPSIQEICYCLDRET